MSQLLPHREVTAGIPGEGCVICKTPPRLDTFSPRLFPAPIHNPQKKEPHMYQQVFGVQACEHCGHGQHHPIHQDFRPRSAISVTYTKGGKEMSEDEYTEWIEREREATRQRQAKKMERRRYDRGDLVFWTAMGVVGGTASTFIVGTVLGW